ARTFLISFWYKAIVAESIAVANPTTATTSSVIGLKEYKILLLAIMYIPAVTIVAAWINADTGVGPAIASGNHVYNGICALLPVAPIKSKRVMIVADGASLCSPSAENTSPKFTEPTLAMIMNMAIKNARSPIRFITN